MPVIRFPLLAGLTLEGEMARNIQMGSTAAGRSDTATRFLLGSLSALVMGVASPALADSISPSTFTGTTGVGGTVSLHKTVTVSAGAPTGAQADVFFLTDTTGSMSGTINSVQSNFGAIASALSGTGNIAYGAGQYKDIGDTFVYHLDQNITTSLPAVQTAINSWSAGGGGDYPEQGLYALGQTATTTTWRDGSKRIVVIAGDAPSWTGGSSPDGSTVASTAATLLANGVTVESINVGGGGLNDYGQFSGPGSLYANGVAGNYFVNADPGTLTSTIESAIGSAFLNYNNVTLQVLGGPAGLGITWTPVNYSGAYDRSIDRTFGFDLTFTGIDPGSYNFSINALVDGGIIATETDAFTVTGGGVPEPASWALMIGGFGLAGATLRRRRAQPALATA
jgi:hypothetical protein